MRKNLDVFSMDIFDVCVAMSEGNMGAVNVLKNVLSEKDMLEGTMFLLNLDDMNIWGSQIWVAYKDYCGEKLDLFFESVSKRDSKMVEAVNIETARSGGGPKAVTNGASYGRKELTNSEVADLQNKLKPKHEKLDNFEF